MATILNSGTDGDLNPGFGGQDGGPTAIVRQTNLQVWVAGAEIFDALSAQVSYGWDQVSGQARIVCITPHGNPGDDVVVQMGTLQGNPIQRFAGTLREIDTTLAPHAIVLLAKGPCYALEEFENGTTTADSLDFGKPGFDLATLTGTAIGDGVTLSQIAIAVLGYAGVTFDASNFDDSGQIFGTLAPENFTWRVGETAIAYLHRLCEASAGYRIFDSADGNVYIRQVSGVPAGSPDVSLTPGVDLFGDSSLLDSSLGQRGAVLVQGYDDGSGPATATAGSGLVFRLNSDLIETNGVAASLADFWLPIVNRRQQIYRLSTHRDELFGPGQTHQIGTQSVWVKSCVTEVSMNGQFTQHTVCVGA